MYNIYIVVHLNLYMNIKWFSCMEWHFDNYYNFKYHSGRKYKQYRSLYKFG